MYNGNKTMGNYSIDDLSKLVSVAKDAKEQGANSVEDDKRYDDLFDMFEKKLTLDENTQKWGVGAPCELDEVTPELGEDDDAEINRLTDPPSIFTCSDRVWDGCGLTSTLHR